MSIWELAKRKLSYESLRWKLRLLSEELRGLDFTREHTPQEIGTDPIISVGYYSSGNKYLKNVLKSLAISPTDNMVDIGCGKGGAMRVMLRFPFSRVNGVEISERLAAIARKNFQILRILPERCRVIAMDASQFQDFDPYNYVYFFNPFTGAVMIKVMANLLASIERKPRKVTIIYNNPTCHDEIVGTGVFRKVGEYPDEWGLQFFVYSNGPYNGNE